MYMFVGHAVLPLNRPTSSSIVTRTFHRYILQRFFDPIKPFDLKFVQLAPLFMNRVFFKKCPLNVLSVDQIEVENETTFFFAKIINLFFHRKSLIKDLFCKYHDLLICALIIRFIDNRILQSRAKQYEISQYLKPMECRTRSGVQRFLLCSLVRHSSHVKGWV